MAFLGRNAGGVNATLLLHIAANAPGKESGQRSSAIGMRSHAAKVRRDAALRSNLFALPLLIPAPRTLPGRVDVPPKPRVRRSAANN